jgi:AlwI restriction endonuclease
MQIWNMGNTTARNPLRLREALQLFVARMSGRPFRKPEQLEFQNAMIDAGLVESERREEGDDGGRKFASAFKQLGFVEDWSHGRNWVVTPVGTLLIEHPELEETIFLRQLLKYQIQSPLEGEPRTRGFHLRPFRLLLRFLRRAYDEKLVGLTNAEIGLYVINILDEDDTTAFEAAITGIKSYRAEYNSLDGKVAKTNFAKARLQATAEKVGVLYGTLKDYADSNGRYALMTGLLTLRGNKLAISEARLPFVDTILADGTTLMPASEYLDRFYDPDYPPLPTDDRTFIGKEIAILEKRFQEIATSVGMSSTLPSSPISATLSELQAYEFRLRERLREVREIQFYRTQRLPESLTEIEDLLESISDGGFASYAPAYFEWAIWRLFLAINDLVGSISDTRGFKVDTDMNPIHHARGGAADLTFTYDKFIVVCEMTLTTGSRQFAVEGEPVTRHVFKAIEDSMDKPVYGLFVAKKVDPNTSDAFHNARYWRDRRTFIATPIVALEIKQILALIQRMKQYPVTVADIRGLLENILSLQRNFESGPSWFEAYSTFYEHWLIQNES